MDLDVDEDNDDDDDDDEDIFGTRVETHADTGHPLLARGKLLAGDRQSVFFVEPSTRPG